MAAFELYVAASRTRGGDTGWAASACQGASVLQSWSGMLRSRSADQASATMAAAANGMAAAIAAGILRHGSRLQIAMDSSEAAANLFGGAPSPRSAPAALLARQMAGASSLAAGTVLHRPVCGSIGAAVREQASVQACLAARHASVPVTAYGAGMSASLGVYHSTEQRGDSAWELRFASQLAVPAPRASGSLALACAVWESGACEARHVHPVLEATLSWHRKSSAQWAMACSQARLCPPVAPGSHPDTAAPVDRLSVREAARLLMSRNPSPRILAALPLASPREGLPGAALKMLLQAAGHDGLSWTATDGSRRHAVRDPGQAVLLPGIDLEDGPGPARGPGR